jgi:putative ABC transport system permease protein
LPTLLSIRQVKPGLIFRRDMAEAKQPWRKRLSAAKVSILSGLIIVLGIAGLASWLVSGTRQEATRFGLVFIGGLLVSLVVLAGVAWLLLYFLRVFVRLNRTRLPTSLRHGIANLYRPGTHAESILTALGIGVMFTLTVYLVQRSVLSEIIRNSPPGMANVFMLDISEQQRGPMAEMLSHHPAVEGDFELIGTVSANIRSINGTPISEIQNIGPGRRRGLASRRIVTSYDKLPKGITVEEGKWWNGQPAEPQVSLYRNLAKYLNVQPGSVIVWNAFGREIKTRVVAIHTTDPHRLAARIDIIFSPGALAGLPTVYYGAVRAKPTQVATLQRDAYAKFPTVTVLNMADIIERVQEVVEQVTFVIRFISLFAILAGATILASSVAGTRFRRVREVVILKTLGATRGRVARIFSAEFLILGTVAGLMGSILASFFTMVVLTRLMKLQFHFDPLPNLISIVLTALVAAAAGWLASFRILGQKPLEVLRGE